MPVEVDPPSKITWDSRDDWAQVLSHFIESGRTDFKPISTTSRGWVIWTRLCDRSTNQNSVLGCTMDDFHYWLPRPKHSRSTRSCVHDLSTSTRDARHFGFHASLQAFRIDFKHFNCIIPTYPATSIGAPHPASSCIICKHHPTAYLYSEPLKWAAVWLFRGTTKFIPHSLITGNFHYPLSSFIIALPHFAIYPNINGALLLFRHLIFSIFICDFATPHSPFLSTSHLIKFFQY